MEDIIIIGAGPIGIYSAHLARLHNLKGFVLESLGAIGGQLTEIYPEKDIIDVPGFSSISARKLIERLQAQQLSVENPLPINVDERAVTLRPTADYLTVETVKGSYETRSVLLTTGMGVFTPRKIGLENEDRFSNIIYAVKEKDSLRGKEVVILGGGNSAVDWALALAKLAKKVSIVHRREEFRAQSASIDKMIQLGVDIYKPYTVKELIGANDLLEEVVLESANRGVSEVRIGLDVLIVNYGNITLRQGFPLETVRGIAVVDRSHLTSLKNVYAVGNACTYEGKVSNITSGFGEAVTAIAAIDRYIHPGKNIPTHF